MNTITLQAYAFLCLDAAERAAWGNAEAIEVWLAHDMWTYAGKSLAETAAELATQTTV